MSNLGHVTATFTKEQEKVILERAFYWMRMDGDHADDIKHYVPQAILELKKKGII